MKALLVWLGAIGVVLGLSIFGAHAETYYWTTIDPASSEGRRAIEVALPEFKQNGPDIENYATRVSRRRDDARDLAVVVLFYRPGRPAGMRGSSDEWPAFEVHLDPDMTGVIRSHISR